MVAKPTCATAPFTAEVMKKLKIMKIIIKIMAIMEHVQTKYIVAAHVQGCLMA
jgi:hypothetical protein